MIVSRCKLLSTLLCGEFADSYSDPSDRPTADTLLRLSTFCTHDPYYNFYDTDLYAKLRTIDAGLSNVG